MFAPPLPCGSGRWNSRRTVIRQTVIGELPVRQTDIRQTVIGKTTKGKQSLDESRFSLNLQHLEIHLQSNFLA